MLLSDVVSYYTDANKNPAEAGSLFKSFESGLRGSANRANAGASAAGNAGISVDNELAVSLGDGGNGTFLSARATGDALVADRICHCQYLLYYFVGSLYTITGKNAIQKSSGNRKCEKTACENPYSLVYLMTTRGM